MCHGPTTKATSHGATPRDASPGIVSCIDTFCNFLFLFFHKWLEEEEVERAPYISRHHPATPVSPVAASHRPASPAGWPWRSARPPHPGALFCPALWVPLPPDREDGYLPHVQCLQPITLTRHFTLLLGLPGHARLSYLHVKQSLITHTCTPDIQVFSCYHPLCHQREGR